MHNALNPSAPILNDRYNNKASSENNIELHFAEGEALLSWNGRQLIYFQSPVKVAGEEILDWKKKGMLTEIVSLENTRDYNEISIAVKELAPVYSGKRIVPERSYRSLLLNPQWFSVYFISFLNPILQEEELTSFSQSDGFTDAAFRKIRAGLMSLFEPGKALADYGNHKLFLGNLKMRPAA